MARKGDALKGNAVTSRVKVLFAIPSLDRDGPDRVMFELLVALDRARYSPALVTSVRGGHYFDRLPRDVEVTVLERHNRRERRYPCIDAMRLVRRLAPDIVFTTLRMNLTMGLIRRAFPQRTRLVIRQANDFSSDFSRLIRTSVLKHRVARQLTVAALRGADAVVCQSDWMRGDLAAVLGERVRLITIANPIDVADVRRTASATAPNLRGRPALVSVGRLSTQKGFDLLLEAIAVVRRGYPDIHVTVFGEGEAREQLLQHRAQLGLDSCVSFVGHRHDVVANVRGADLFVLSSRYEGFPNAALEALACGTPVVLTNCPGANSDIVRPGFNGELAASCEPAAIASALEKAIRRSSSYDREAITGDTEHRFGARHIVSRYEELFSAVSEGREWR